MKTNNINHNRKFPIQILVVLMTFFLFVSCEDYLETDNPTGQIPHQEIFEDEATATAAVTTMYAKLRDEVLITGNVTGLSVQLGMYADEFHYYGPPGGTIEPFYQHQLLASTEPIGSVWNRAYNLIYMANATLEGVENSQGLSEPVKNQLKGEALFIRALTHFYMVNLFGDAPYITSTDYRENSQAVRTPASQVLEMIVNDLVSAKSILNESYITDERIRANKWVAAALLARVYLYLEQWQNAVDESSTIINNSSLYNLPANLDEEFLNTSQSAILQLKTKVEGFSTTEALTMVFVTAPPPTMALTDDLINKMEANDQRKTQWIGEVTDGTNYWYYPNKYKQGNLLQYSTVFRLAEQYLIRAEARARLGNSTGAQEDINIIRNRAGLQNTTAQTTDELIDAVISEKRFELFTEHGHRWFDLKRLGLAGSVLEPLKPAWKPTNILWPIPEAELMMNPNLQPQNPGY